jgi:SAM-dependent methyltransferase
VERPQRLVFGTAAEAYEAHRPGYPAALFDELIGLVGSDARALDAGSGTGKVAVALAARGVAGTAIEPDLDMAAVARRRLEGTGWEVLVDDFETCDLDAGVHDLFTCGQAWHWIDTERGLAQVRRALRPGGVAAIFWNRPEFPDTALRADLDAVYARLAPDMESSLAARAHGPKGLPPPVDPPPDGFRDARASVHRHAVHHTSRSWVGLLGTHSDHLRLEDGRRGALHGAVADVIDRHGGALEVVYRCEVWLARRTG